MKIKVCYILWFALSLGLASCELDNYEAPDSSLKGRIVYNGEPINVGYDQVYFELWEPGWQEKSPINVVVDQDGSFSALLFNANYKLIIPASQGPFISNPNDATQSDTILVNLNGNQTLDIEVTPYYMIRNPQFSVSGRTVSANFGLEKIITDANAKDVERVSLYVNKTYFVDLGNNIAATNINGGDIADMNNISLSVEAPAITPAQNYVFARVGVKISGVEDMIFSPIEKVQIQ
ncbi:DUF3823 domain-containing protein [Pontibacter sp. 172403-2]|uniref:DUF3823 domain-containing protein n=1 Tax=Pontibacter rufus TaxID=2791028 RepID=UPI0018AFCC4C|nr:DUF3823 domain-containing protein [Pontibacter sp. 172403-2]MBF9254607.1 DUF3823 domain-containing protein [Pontibacter sp. 172403-2]